jgi:hypothetical protein
MVRVSRKRFQEALRALKQACKNERLPFTQRIRAAELILAVYGVPLPENSPRTRRTVKELVSENAFDRRVRQQVRDKAMQDEKAPEVKGIFDDLICKRTTNADGSVPVFSVTP